MYKPPEPGIVQFPLTRTTQEPGHANNADEDEILGPDRRPRDMMEATAGLHADGEICEIGEISPFSEESACEISPPFSRENRENPPISPISPAYPQKAIFPPDSILADYFDFAVTQ